MYYRWRQEYNGLRVDQARRVKELKQANAKLKRLVSELFPIATSPATKDALKEGRKFP